MSIRERIALFTCGIILVLTIILLIFPYVPIMIPAPRNPFGRNGYYSIDGNRLIYKTKLDKNTLLRELEKDGLCVKNSRIDSDPSWDSLGYLIDSVSCDMQKIEPHIEFFSEKNNGFTTFYIYGINAMPNESYDTTIYINLTRRYYDCFETILSKHGVQWK